MRWQGVPFAAPHDFAVEFDSAASCGRVKCMARKAAYAIDEQANSGPFADGRVRGGPEGVVSAIRLHLPWWWLPCGYGPPDTQTIKHLWPLVNPRPSTW